MSLNNFNYYGYDKETYMDCLDMIRSTNRGRIEIVNIWFIIINIVIVYFSMNDIFGLNSSRVPVYLAFAAVSVAFELVILFAKKFSARYATGLAYINMIFMLFYGVNMSIAQPYMAATMFVVFLVLAALAYIDNMLRMTIILVAGNAFFLYESFSKKPVSIAYQDLYNALIFFSLAIILHYSFQRGRMSQFVTYQKNIQITHELEVKSSFDALTSLLNRGRFFSMAGDVLRTKDYGEYIAICLLDLDSFKQINDKLGHQMGDKAIQMAGSTISDKLGIDLSEKWRFQERVMSEGTSFAGRLGGDEFIILMRGKNNDSEVMELLEEILHALNAVEFGELKGIHASFGVTVVKPDDRDIDSAYKRADDALYESKRSGKNQIRFFEKLQQSGGVEQ